MPILLLILLVGVFAYSYWRHRTTTLTRACRWREDRSADRDGTRTFGCASCGAQTRCPVGKTPRHCGALPRDRD